MRLVVRLALLATLAACSNGGGEQTSDTYLGDGVDRWAKRLASRDLETQEFAMNQLAFERSDSVPVLVGLQDDPRPQVLQNVWTSIHVLVDKLSGDSERLSPFLAVLERAARHDHRDLAMTGLRGLAALGTEAEPAAPAAERWLDEGDPELRLRAAETLLAIDPASTTGLESVAPLLGDPEWRDEAEAVFAKAPERRLPALLAVVEGGPPEARGPALHAIGLLRGEASSAAPVLRELLADDDERLRGRAALALARVRPGDGEALDTLDGLLRSGPVIRELAARALVGLGEEGGARLVAALRDDSPDVRVVAARFLWLTERAPDEAAPALLAAIAGESRGAREMAGETLWSDPERAAPLVPRLVEILEAGNREARIGAAMLLGRLGEAATAAREALEAAKGTEDAELREAVEYALERIGE